MPFSIVFLILGIVLIRTVGSPGRRHGRPAHGARPLDEKLTRLEAQVADLQDQLEQDRAQIARLQEERDFLRQLYPEKGPAT